MTFSLQTLVHSSKSLPTPAVFYGSVSDGGEETNQPPAIPQSSDTFGETPINVVPQPKSLWTASASAYRKLYQGVKSLSGFKIAGRPIFGFLVKTDAREKTVLKPVIRKSLQVIATPANSAHQAKTHVTYHAASTVEFMEELDYLTLTKEFKEILLTTVFGLALSKIPFIKNNVVKDVVFHGVNTVANIFKLTTLKEVNIQQVEDLEGQNPKVKNTQALARATKTFLENFNNHLSNKPLIKVGNDPRGEQILADTIQLLKALSKVEMKVFTKNKIQFQQLAQSLENNPEDPRANALKGLFNKSVFATFMSIAKQAKEEGHTAKAAKMKSLAWTFRFSHAIGSGLHGIGKVIGWIPWPPFQILAKPFEWGGYLLEHAGLFMLMQVSLFGKKEQPKSSQAHQPPSETLL